ncbi:thiol-disulfide oxidoreductase DCC family protein [Brevundimonas subvibrioides]|uniref:thiol-disulfide oxidoreductase DCC family protein n=1 Tax=Brevundimonas subvibrioides TaxID=74313 RepID=UPI0022B3F33E|nr:DCC1-like thiol-disulfide oxidoreductase family protein [Brevundimonas subvibrioides]
MATAPYSYRVDPSVPPFPDDRAVVVFDGDCAMCSGSARMILRRDRRDRFRVLAAQSPLGRALYRHYRLDDGDLSTFILIENGKALFKSDAAIRVAEQLGGLNTLAGLLRIVPPGLRDAAYDWVARNRLRFLRRRPVCILLPEVDPGRILG